MVLAKIRQSHLRIIGLLDFPLLERINVLAEVFKPILNQIVQRFPCVVGWVGIAEPAHTIHRWRPPFFVDDVEYVVLFLGTWLAHKQRIVDVLEILQPLGRSGGDGVSCSLGSLGGDRSGVSGSWVTWFGDGGGFGHRGDFKSELAHCGICSALRTSHPSSVQACCPFSQSPGVHPFN